MNYGNFLHSLLIGNDYCIVVNVVAQISNRVQNAINHCPARLQQTLTIAEPQHMALSSRHRELGSLRACIDKGPDKVNADR